MYWIWAILLLVLGVGLALLEVFFPSAGILAFLAASALLAAIVMGFMQGTLAGILIFLGALAGLPTIIMLGFKYWPKTRMGKRVLLMAPNSEEVLPDDPEKERLKGLIGRTARAKSKMLLSGIIVIDGSTVDAVSESMPIEVGQKVRIVQVHGHRVVVRPVDEEPTEVSPVDPLQQTYEEPFEMPPS